MRDKNFDVDLLKTLNDHPMPETPLTDDEFTRVLDAACGRLPQKKPAGHRRFPWERVAAAVVACLAVGLGSINFAAPAVAEQLPVVGSLFSWLNRGGQEDYTSLHSEQLNKYAETVEATAESADTPYTLTLGQVFNDGDWLRISLMLTAEDDSLAGFNAIGPREDAVEKALQNGGGQYGTLVLDNGTELSGGVTFGKRDDRTFVTGINYELFLAHDDLAGHTATLTLSDLMACNKSIVETDGKSAGDLGELIYFFEYSCGLSGYLLDVNPFDQPGVEAYKKNMFALLGKPGYEDRKAELEASLKD